MVNFSDLNITNLRNIVREYNIHNRIPKYRSLPKDELITEIEKHLKIDNDGFIKLIEKQIISFDDIKNKKKINKKTKAQNKKIAEVALKNIKIDKDEEIKVKPEIVEKELKKIIAQEAYTGTKFPIEEPKKEKKQIKKIVKAEPEKIEVKPKKEKKVNEELENKIDAIDDKINELENKIKKYNNDKEEELNKMIKENNILITKTTGAKERAEAFEQIKKQGETIEIKYKNKIDKVNEKIKELEKDKKKMKGGANMDNVIFTRAQFIKEHKRLTSVLLPFIKKDAKIKKEYYDQLKELNDVEHSTKKKIVMSYDDWLTEHKRLTEEILNKYPEMKDELKKQSKEMHMKGAGLNDYAIHAVIVKKSVPYQSAFKIAQDITHKKTMFHRETAGYHRFRNISKQKFMPKTFRTKRVNDTTNIIFGRLRPEYNHLVGAGILDFFKKGVEKVKSLFNLPDQYNNVSKRTLEKYGDKPIQKLTLMRTPIVSALEKALNLISGNRFTDLKKKYGYDQLFHLSLVADIDNKKIMIEKNEVININDTGFKVSKESEFIDVPLNNKVLKLNEMMEKANKLWNPPYKMFEYHPFSNNCQIFLKNILSGSGLLTSELEKWLYQPLEQVIAELPRTSKIAKFITDTGAVVSKIMGRGEMGNKKLY